MKKKKRFSIIMILVFTLQMVFFSGVPMRAKETSSMPYGTEGFIIEGNTIIGYSGEYETEMRIPSKVDGVQVQGIADNAFVGENNVTTTLFIPWSMENCEYDFGSWTALKTVYVDSFDRDSFTSDDENTWKELLNYNGELILRDITLQFEKEINPLTGEATAKVTLTPKPPFWFDSFFTIKDEKSGHVTKGSYTFGPLTLKNGEILTIVEEYDNKQVKNEIPFGFGTYKVAYISNQQTANRYYFTNPSTPDVYPSLSDLGLTAPAGKMFKGWSTIQDSTNAEYMAGSEMTVPKENEITLYAVFEDAKGFTIDSEGTITGYTGIYQEDFTIPEEVDGIPVKDIGFDALKNDVVKTLHLPWTMSGMKADLTTQFTALEKVYADFYWGEDEIGLQKLIDELGEDNVIYRGLGLDLSKNKVEIDPETGDYNIEIWFSRNQAFPKGEFSSITECLDKVVTEEGYLCKYKLPKGTTQIEVKETYERLTFEVTVTFNRCDIIYHDNANTVTKTYLNIVNNYYPSYENVFGESAPAGFQGWSEIESSEEASYLVDSVIEENMFGAEAIHLYAAVDKEAINGFIVDENGIITGYKGKYTENFTIPSAIGGIEIKGIADGAFGSESAIVKTLSIPGNLEYMPEDFFNQWTSLETLNITGSYSAYNWFLNYDWSAYYESEWFKDINMTDSHYGWYNGFLIDKSTGYILNYYGAYNESLTIPEMIDGVQVKGFEESFFTNWKYDTMMLDCQWDFLESKWYTEINWNNFNSTSWYQNMNIASGDYLWQDGWLIDRNTGYILYYYGEYDGQLNVPAEVGDIEVKGMAEEFFENWKHDTMELNYEWDFTSGDWYRNIDWSSYADQKWYNTLKMHYGKKVWGFKELNSMNSSDEKLENNDKKETQGEIQDITKKNYQNYELVKTGNIVSANRYVFLIMISALMLVGLYPKKKRNQEK